MPHLNYSDDNPDTLKKEFLYSLIAEKLWALEATRLGFDTLDNVKYSLKTLEKMLVKDELFKQEVEAKIFLTGDEIAEGMDRVINLLKVNIITLRDSSEALRIFGLLKDNKADFDSLLKLEDGTQKVPFEITLGKLKEEIIEDICYSLKPGEISSPTKTNGGWLIFKLKEIVKNPAINPSSEQARNNAIQILRERKRRKLAGEFIDKALGGKSFSADKKLFNLFADALITEIKNKLSLNDADSSLKYQLNETDILKTLNHISVKELSETFISKVDQSLTLKDFIYYLVYQKVEIPFADPIQIKSVLNKAVRQFIEDEVLALEGFKRKLNNLSSVKNDIKIWQDNYLSLLLMENEAKNISVTENDLMQYQIDKKNLSDSVFQINIVEILTDDIKVIEIILDELQNGVEFEELAKKNNQREKTKNSGGEWGLMPVSKLGEIGKITLQMKTGEIYGPIKLPEGYSIFKLVEKNVREILSASSLEENKEFLRLQLTLQKMNSFINNKTVEYARGFGISINQRIFNNITLSEVNTFTYRLIGFGGRIAAFPITTPIFEWNNLYEGKKELP